MDEISRYLYEVGQLKRVKRSGWWVVGVDDPESVAEHSFRTAVIGYLLACLAGADPERVCAMGVFHDIEENRINDPHTIAKRYLKIKPGEESPGREQLKGLPPAIAEKIAALTVEHSGAPDLETQLAHDADLLECLIQAIEYRERGYKDAGDWIENCRNGLSHAVSKELAEACLKTPANSWWKDLNRG
jgi:putative hydrolase of HD superfamily